MTKLLRKQKQKRRHFLSPYQRILIVCEGESEANYFQDLKRCWRLPGLEIICADGKNQSNAYALIATAKRKQAEIKLNRDKYDAIYCVFDCDPDKPKTFIEDVTKKIQQHKFYRVVSWPCLEYWLLLHYKYTRTPFQNGAEVEKEFQKEFQKTHGKEYKKGQEGLFEILESKLKTAQINAGKAQKEVEETRDLLPSTEIHLLIKKIEPMLNL